MGGILPRRSIRETGEVAAWRPSRSTRTRRASVDWRGEVVGRSTPWSAKAAPEASGSIKWAQPVYEQHGPFAYVKAFTTAVNFGFWRGADLTDPDGALEGTGDRMRHVKLRSPEDVDAKRFTAWVKEAVALNDVEGRPDEGSLATLGRRFRPPRLYPPNACSRT